MTNNAQAVELLEKALQAVPDHQLQGNWADLRQLLQQAIDLLNVEATCSCIRCQPCSTCDGEQFTYCPRCDDPAPKPEDTDGEDNS